jgi:pSer/pThr/pTyr-binding forkhead associated (FHA) protein
LNLAPIIQGIGSANKLYSINLSSSNYMLSAIVLNLLNSIPMQSWTFMSEDVISIGRATDNKVVLFSAVVSRHHAELRWSEASNCWQIVNISANGTYINGEPIKTLAVQDGMIVRLATSGPKIQIKFADDPDEA